MARKISQEEILSRFKNVHGDRYDYTAVKYTRMKDKVYIKCYKHGFFMMRPLDHLHNHGCPKCGYHQRQLTKISNEKQLFDEKGISFFQRRYQKIHQTRRQKNNYKEAGRKGKFTLLQNNKWESWRTNWYNSKVNNGTIISPASKLNYKRYRKAVRRITLKTLSSQGEYIGWRPDLYERQGLTVNHKCSIKHCFEGGLSVFEASHIVNLQLLSKSDNSKKFYYSLITAKELRWLIHNFNKLNTIR